MVLLFYNASKNACRVPKKIKDFLGWDCKGIFAKDYTGYKTPRLSPQKIKQINLLFDFLGNPLSRKAAAGGGLVGLP